MNNGMKQFNPHRKYSSHAKAGYTLRTYDGSMPSWSAIIDELGMYKVCGSYDGKAPSTPAERQMLDPLNPVLTVQLLRTLDCVDTFESWGILLSGTLKSSIFGNGTQVPLKTISHDETASSTHEEYLTFYGTAWGNNARNEWI